MEEAKKRTRRSKDEVRDAKIKVLEDRIADYKEKIANAEKEISDLKCPPVNGKDVLNKADEYGISPEELMDLVEKAGKKKNKE